MDIGISSACFYPNNVEKAFRNVGELGAKTAEIFINSFSELDGSLFNELCSIKDFYGIEVRSLHPFTCAIETLLFFSPYERRKDDSVEFYKKYFNAAAKLGAEAVVLHGGETYIESTPELYAENYLKLHTAARHEGVYIAQENVRRRHCADPKFMKAVADYIGDDFRMVLDIKQCRRENQNEFEFIDLLGEKIIQVHISDFDDKHDCLPPGEGKYDFKKLFSALNNKGYNKSSIIELYQDNYKNISQIADALGYLNEKR